MITELNSITLRSGEIVQAAILTAPEPEWAERMLALLSHKGDPWNWQNAAVLERDLGFDANFYILHRDGAPFANVMTVERNGVGIFGHVWTNPEDRQKGASAALLKIQMDDFTKRDGQALYLTTGNPVAHRLYKKYGFCELQSGNELMAYTASPLGNFEEAYFGSAAKKAVTVRPLAWPHWPAACPLFIGSSKGVVRAASLGMIGRTTPEEAFLPLLRERERNPEQPSRAVVLELDNGAVAGLATWGEHPFWPNICIVDLYCHQQYWSYGEALWDALALPTAHRLIAYSEDSCRAKNVLLMQKGFVQEARLPKWLPRLGNTKMSDLLIYGL